MNMPHHRRLVALAALALALLAPVPPLARAAEPAPGSTPAAPAKRPNIVFILADDLGWRDLACFGSSYYETPNIDKLAARGTKFTNGYSCGPNCQPTRAALLSGQYGPRTGVYTVGNIDRFNWRSRPLRPVDNVTALPLEKVTFAAALKKAGYATGMFGKWHLGPTAGNYAPGQRGFDEAIESSGKHFDFKTHPPVEYPKGQYLADFLTDRAVEFITKHKDEPFLLYLPHYAVHAPHQAKPELIEKFKNEPGAGGQNNPTYAAMIYSVDESVGRIVKTLDDLKLADNTLVIFSSDNGGVGGYEREGIRGGHDVTDNAPLRGGKGMLYEGGIRVPFIFRWPGHIAAGAVDDTPIARVDLYPSFLDLAGAPRPDNYVLDGVDLLPLLTQRKPLERDALYWHFPGYLGAGKNAWRTTPAGAIRSGDDKLIEFFEDGRLELYDLKTDSSEKHDLAKKKPELARQLHEKLIAWRKEVGAKMPTPITAADKASAPKKIKKGKRQRNRAVGSGEA
jgi:arylsulfatase A-like enzyme